MALITSKNREYFSQKLYDYSGLFYSRNDDLDYVLSDINGTELSVTWSEEEMFEYLDKHEPEFMTFFNDNDVLNPVLIAW